MTAAEHATEASKLLDTLDPGNPDRHFWVALASAHAFTALALDVTQSARALDAMTEQGRRR